MVKVLANVTKKTEKLIGKCLSKSNVCGKDLRDAHYLLGTQLGLQIKMDNNFNSKYIGVLIMMRAGLPFGLGLADQLEKDNDVDILFSPTLDTEYSKYDYLIVADAVINTGKTIFEAIKHIDVKKVIVAANVISEKNIANFDNLNAYTVRVSSHAFKGSKVKTVSDGNGPDTGDRLFSSSFYS